MYTFAVVQYNMSDCGTPSCVCVFCFLFPSLPSPLLPSSSFSLLFFSPPRPSHSAEHAADRRSKHRRFGTGERDRLWTQA